MEPSRRKLVPSPEESIALTCRLSQHSFDDNSVWPEVIEQESRTGDGHPLLFPVFHRDILFQTHWEPGDVIGRISVVIAEGVLRIDNPHPKPHTTFDRLRDVVTFAFQHASLGMSTTPP